MEKHWKEDSKWLCVELELVIFGFEGRSFSHDAIPLVFIVSKKE